MPVPPFAKGIVVGYNPSDQDSITIMFPGSGQIVGYPIKILHRGAADAMRVDQDPLPTRGTWGLIAFPDGDIRNGIWLGAFYPSKQNAVTSPTGDPTVRYHAHWSGDWDYLDGSGNAARQWADGSYVVAASGAGGLPGVFRQLVDATKQTVSRVLYNRTDRIPNPPSAFVFKFAHASGTQVAVDAAGNASVTAASGASITLQGNGGTFVLGSDGNITMTPTATVTVNGNIVTNGAITASGDITAGTGGGDSVTLQNHTHGGVQSGASHTAKPDAGT